MALRSLVGMLCELAMDLGRGLENVPNDREAYLHILKYLSSRNVCFFVLGSGARILSRHFILWELDQSGDDDFL